MNKRIILTVLVALGYIGTIVAANWAVQKYGPVPVGFGLEAAAGVYFVGIAFTFRDLLQRVSGDRYGVWVVIAAIAIGTLVSYTVASGFAVASAVAFAASETVDFGVFLLTVKKLGFVGAVVVSNCFAIVVDSFLFLKVAPPLVPIPGWDNMDLLKGQIVGKAWMTAPFLILWLVLAIRERRQAQVA